jgi:hypothetical protein
MCCRVVLSCSEYDRLTAARFDCGPQPQLMATALGWLPAEGRGSEMALMMVAGWVHPPCACDSRRARAALCAFVPWRHQPPPGLPAAAAISPGMCPPLLTCHSEAALARSVPSILCLPAFQSPLSFRTPNTGKSRLINAMKLVSKGQGALQGVGQCLWVGAHPSGRPADAAGLVRDAAWRQQAAVAGALGLEMQHHQVGICSGLLLLLKPTLAPD